MVRVFTNACATLLTIRSCNLIRCSAENVFAGILLTMFCSSYYSAPAATNRYAVYRAFCNFPWLQIEMTLTTEYKNVNTHQ